MIRLARFDDAPKIIELGQQLTRAGAWAITSIDFKAAMSRILDGIRDPHQWVGVAEHDGKIVGFLMLVAQPMWWNPKHWQVVDDIIYCVRPGMGRKLLQAGFEWIDKLPVDVRDVIISLNSGLDTERAVGAMIAAGMVKRGVTLSFDVRKRKQRWAA